jgi:hypothetical protein
MGKTNFTKVEKALEDGLIKMTSQQLWELAESSVQSSKALPPKEICTAILQSLERDLKKMHSKDNSLYKKIGFTRENLKKLIAHPELLTPQDWKQIQEVRIRIEKYKKDLAASLPHLSDDAIIEQERAEHINKRFNVNKKWIPLK